MSLTKEGLSHNNHRKGVNRRTAVRLISAAIAAPVAAKLADELGFLPNTTPEAEAANERFKDIYHTDSMTINTHTNEIVSVITANGKNFISIGKISEGRIGQTVQEMTSIDLDSDPKKLVVNPNPNKSNVRISESGQRLDISGNFDDRALFLPIHANKAINFDRNGDVAIVNGDGKVLLIDVNNPAFREVTRTTSLEYNSFSRLTKDQAGALNGFAGSAEGLKSIKIDAARRETITNVNIPGVSGEVANIKNVTLPGGREGMVFSNGRKAFIVDAQNPTQVLQSVDISFNAGDAQIKGLAVNKTTGELAVSVWSPSQQKTVIEGYTNGSQTTRMERFLDASGLDTRELKRETDVDFIYDPKENNRGYLVAMSFQGVFRADGRKFAGQGGELGKVIPLGDPKNLIPVTPTSTPRPTNTAVPTPTATQAPATPTPIPADREINVVDYSAKGGVMTALVDRGDRKILVRNNGPISQGTFRTLHNQLPREIQHIAVSPANPQEMIVTGRDSANKLLLAHSADGGATFYPSNGPTVSGTFELSAKPTISENGQIAIVPHYASNGSGGENYAEYFMTKLNKTTLDIQPVIMPFPNYDNVYRALDLLRSNGANYEFFANRWEGSKNVLRRILIDPNTGTTTYNNLTDHTFAYGFVAAQSEADIYWLLMDTNPAAGQQLTNVRLNSGYGERASYGLPKQENFDPSRVKVDTAEQVAYDFLYNGQTAPRKVIRFNLGTNQPMADVPLTDELRSSLVGIISPSELRASSSDRVLGALRGVQAGRFPQLYVASLTETQPTWKAAILES